MYIYVRQIRDQYDKEEISKSNMNLKNETLLINFFFEFAQIDNTVIIFVCLFDHFLDLVLCIMADLS